MKSASPADVGAGHARPAAKRRGAPGMLVVAGVGLLLLAPALSAQVARDANSGYQTPEQRKGLAAGLGNPERDQTQKPGELVRNMGVRRGMTVADIGTGVGYMLPYLSRAVGPDGHVVAEDIFDDFLAAARQRVENQNLSNVTLVKGSDTDPHLPEGQLDEALVLDAYHHFDYPEKMLALISKALKADGRLVIVEYYKRPEAMPNGRAMTHIRLDMPDVIKEVESYHFHLVREMETIKNVQYMLVLEKSGV
jgi:ubiquinone/menaquinone biosynthesis C-methylase UbiE